jgi:hypothetical protein
MNLPAKISRRRVVSLLCALGVASSAVVAAPAGDCAPELAEDLDAVAMRELAAECRARYPTHTSSGSLLTLLADQTAENALSRLREAVEQDYAQDRVLELSGWRLSSTEATLFVLLSECAQPSRAVARPRAW